MDYRCPHCQASLKWRRVLPPTHDNAIAAGSAERVCPACDGGLIFNPHRDERGLTLFGLDIEIAAYAVLGLALLLAALLQALLHPLLVIVATHLIAIALVVWQRWQLMNVRLADWPRYRSGTLRFIEQQQFPQ